MSITHAASPRAPNPCSPSRPTAPRRGPPARPAVGYRPARAVALLGLALALTLCAGACGGGEYGFARTYTPLTSEQTHFDEAQEATYQDLLRDPRRFEKTEIGWFGTVNQVEARPEGLTRLTLSLRAHQARHLCAEDSRSSCRVTVSEAQLGVFTVDLQLKPAELTGKDRIWVGSLLKVYGTHSGEYSEETGPVLKATYYRHWPRGYYVTTAARGSMRR